MKKQSTPIKKARSAIKKKSGVIASSNQHSPQSPDQFPIVAIGASAGGLEAMTEFLKNLPPDTGMAFIYAQHLSPEHKSMLPEILSKSTKMKVQDIDDMDKIQPNNVFVIPHNKAIKVVDGHIKLIPRPANSSAISIDILFTSLAQAQKERVIGIILSGSAYDGSRGIKEIKQEGGLTFAQDDTAKFGSMPQSGIATGAVDFVLSPKEMALELARLSKHPFVKLNNVKARKEDLIEDSNPDLQNIIIHLRRVASVDFSAYKMNTIKRRIIRRMVLHKIKTLKEYRKLLNEKKEETDLLHQDLLINVTSFFRDTEAHKYLQTTLFPKMLKSKKNGEPLRIWVPACSTGEEVFSIAMILIELQEKKDVKIPVQIFANDISEPAIAKARTGMFSKQDVETVSPKRIQRFFTKTDVGYRISKLVREMCVFAPHNILNDPPFSSLDFISCCNLFIYFDMPAQKKALGIFHYALNDDGYLMLGKSEAVSTSAHLFAVVNKPLKIFSRKKQSGDRSVPAFSSPFMHYSVTQENPAEVKPKNLQTAAKKSSPGNSSLDSAIDAVLVSEFMPANVVINHAMEILQFRGSTDLYLTHVTGKATFNILKMARPEIAFELRSVISNAIKTKQRACKSGIEMKVNDAVHIINVEAIPLKIEWDEPLLLVLFSEHEQVEIMSQNKGEKSNTAAKDRRIKKLEEELASVRADALAFAQEQEAFTEELQSANEEVVSSNEELQTMNEELETSKEEIESVNEELRSTNEEMQTRNELLNEAYEYSEAITATIHDPMLILDKDLRVKSANKTFYKNFRVNEKETEGVLVYDLGNRQWNIRRLREFLEEIILKNTYIHNFEVTHTFPDIGKKIMLLNASRIIQKTHREQLILLIIEDVTEIRSKTEELQQKEKELQSKIINDHTTEKTKLEKAVAERTKELQQLNETLVKSEQRYHLMIREVKDYAILFLSKEGIIENWNEGAERIKGYTQEEIIGKSFTIFYNERDRQNRLPERLLGEAFKNGRATHEGWRVRKDGSMFWGSIVITALHDAKGSVLGFSKVTRDLTDRKNAEDRIKETNEQLIKKNEDLLKMNKELESFAYVSSHDLQEPLRKIQTLAARLLEKEKENLSDTGKEYFRRMHDAAKRMQILIHDLLAFSRLNSNERKFETADISVIIEDVKRDLKEVIAEKNATIKVNGNCEAKVVLFQFRQLMQNLIGNSLKFSNPEIPPRITIRCINIKSGDTEIAKLPEKKVYSHISVSDNGVGFEKEFREKIFEVFQRLHSRHEYPGTGIGLAIVKKIVENHNGIITATSELGKGATFNIFIPA